MKKGEVNYECETKRTVPSVRRCEQFRVSVFSKGVMQIAKSNGLKNPMWFLKSVKLVGTNFRQTCNPTTSNTVLNPVAEVALEETGSPEPIETIQSLSIGSKIVKQAKLAVEIENLVPDSDSTYVPFGFHKDLVNIIKSGMFYPTFICGLSGNGKTMMVEQVCANSRKAH